MYNDNNILKINKKMVLSQILTNKTISRLTIANNLRLTTGAISRIAKDLIDSNLVTEDKKAIINNSKRGRREIGLKIRPEAGFIIGISLNAFAQSVSIANLKGDIIITSEIHLDDTSDSEVVLAKIVNITNKLIINSSTDRNSILGCCAIISGAVDSESGVVNKSIYLWKQQQVKVADYFKKNLDMPVCIENIPNAKMFTEAIYNSKTPSSTILLNVALNLGVSLYLNSQIYRGYRYGTGLLDNWELPTIQGLECKVNDIVAGKGVLSNYDANSLKQISDANQLLLLIKSAQEGDVEVNKLFEKAGLAFRYVIDTLITLLHPEKIIISGPIARVESYKKALFAATGSTDKFDIPEIVFKKISSENAAIFVGLYEFLVKRDIYPKNFV